MPPEPKYTRQDIIQAAYDIVKEQGIEAVVARAVGKRLGTTSTPIFTYFNGMDELKEAVYQKALNESITYFGGCMDYEPAFKEFGMRWIRYAKKNPNFYKLVYMTERGNHNETDYVNDDLIPILESMESEVMKTFGIRLDSARKLIKEMCIHVQGVASICMRKDIDYDENNICESLGRVCISLVVGMKLQEKSIDEQQARRMLAQATWMPQKKV